MRVRQAIPTAAWSNATGPLLAAVARGAHAVDVAPLLVALGELCGEHLPRQDDDVNELSDEVDG